jgi:hypothetical protein
MTITTNAKHPPDGNPHGNTDDDTDPYFDVDLYSDADDRLLRHPQHRDFIPRRRFYTWTPTLSLDLYHHAHLHADTYPQFGCLGGPGDSPTPDPGFGGGLE